MSGDKNCPVCKQNREAIRLKNSHYYFCKDCKLAFNADFQVLKYDDNYFLNDYKRQYNKTYIDDYPHILKISKIRLHRIYKLWKSLYKSRPLSILDIGAALGFFLKAAKDYGFKIVEGVEISRYAATYCKDHFGFFIERKPFQEIKRKKQFDVITGWFFLEHCEDPLSVLKKIFAMLNEKGIAAFSLPSIYGPLYRRHLDQWIKTHPFDHKVDFCPTSIKKYLLEIGFKRVKVYPAAFHPERVMSKKIIFFPLLRFFYIIYSKVRNYSDTMEVYAIK